MGGRTRARGLQFASMTAVVVLALTGFSTGRGSSGGSGSSGGDGGSGGGGCSSSSQDHDTSSSSSSSGGTSGLGKSDDYDDSYDDDSYDDSSTEDTGSGEGQLQSATVRLVTCASAKQPYATVEVTNPNAVDAEFSVMVSFIDGSQALVENGEWQVEVAAGDKATARIEMADTTMAASVDRCEAEPEAEPKS